MPLRNASLPSFHSFRRSSGVALWYFAAFFASAAGAFAAETPPASLLDRPLLSPVFGDHVVLQRDKPNRFWGWAKPGQHVAVKISDKSVQAVAGDDGRWQVEIGVPPAGGPYTVEVDAGERLVLHDVLVGDVWLCGGQSNMELSLRGTVGAESEIQSADRPLLRFCKVTSQVRYVPDSVAKMEWSTSTPETASRFSAVAYHFGRRLQAELGVPIGLITDALGGSPAESWMSAGALARVGEFSPQIAEIARLHKRSAHEYGSFLMHWLDEHDTGGRDEAWAKSDFNDHSWRAVEVPGHFDQLGTNTDVVVAWFRREVILPDPLPAGAAMIFAGVIERMDTFYLNGRWIGASSWVEHPRAYPIPGDALKPGKNVIALRVFKSKPDGGFLSPADALYLKLGDGQKIPLAGSWRAAVSYEAKAPTTLPLDYENYPTMPTVLYNGMIAPLAPLAITGAIWYQGEANAWRPQEQYRKLLPALIADWRSAFQQGEFPFYVVSLPAFTPRKTVPGGSDSWAELREAQTWTVRNTRNTALAITVDTGDAENIHPLDKAPVGDRLARCALEGHYRRAIVASGPTLRFLERRGPELALHFDHADGGLTVRGDMLGEFSIAGSDGVWHWAQAHIEGSDVVVVSSPEVSAPVAARYASQGNPLATLFNGAGLPAVPFRTDD